MLRARLPQNHPELPAAMGTIGAARRIAGDVDGALGTLERALARLRRSGNPDVTDLAVLQGNYGLALRDARRLDDAWRTMEDVEALFRELRGDDDPDVARSVSNLGEIAMLMGNLDVAETKLAEGVEIFERTAGPDHPDTAEARSVLAQVRALAGRAGPDAVSRVESDLETVQSVVGVSELRLAVILFRLGAIKAALGDTDAKDVLRRARSMMVDRGMPETHADIADLDELIART
jgi:serine/threonine-protein kinase